MGEPVILNNEQLRQLAKIILYQEAERIHSVKFTSESELVKYLQESKDGYQCMLYLLDAGAELVHKFDKDNTRSPIAHDIFSYVEYSVNYALQCVRNYTLRRNYLNKISEHAKSIIKALVELDPNNVINVACLAKEAAQYRNAMLQYTRNYQSVPSRNFSKWLKESEIKFEDLVIRYKRKKGFSGAFKNLKDEQKLQVYEAIIKASGRGNVKVSHLSKAFGVAGIAMLLLTAGLMVWDIFSSGHVLQTATYHAVVTVASVGGAYLGEIVGAALSTSLIGVEASALFVVMVGLISSIAGAFIFGAVAGWLVDLIIGSGGTIPLSTDGHQCYVAPMPDGTTLARQILHQKTG